MNRGAAQAFFREAESMAGRTRRRSTPAARRLPPPPRLALWQHFLHARGGATDAASTTAQVGLALRQLPSPQALRSTGRGLGLASDLDGAMQRIGQLTTLISVLDGLRGLLDPAQN
jgi:hypothetical protein